MDVVIDLRSGAVHVADAEDLRHVAVQAVTEPGAPGDGDGVPGSLTALAAALHHHHRAGFVDTDGSARVAPSAVRRLVRTGSDLVDGWESRVAAMLDHAATRGWIAEDGTIRARVEWQMAS